MPIKPSELILNPDGSIYHLNLKPKDIADTIIFVGDQDRVSQVTKHFDSIYFETQKREFKTQTGLFKGKCITVISTGIGTDNIDIVLNELDALVNIDFGTRTIKKQLKSLNIVRIGTTGAVQKDIPLDSFLISTHALDLVGMLHAYQIETISNSSLEDAFIAHTNWGKNRARPIVVEGSKTLIDKFKSDQTHEGLTVTASGFYGPQGRILRLPISNESLNKNMESFSFGNTKITNLEMETSGIYGLAKLLGHRAISLNAIIANRPNGTFSSNPKATIEKLITHTLERI
ncbi:nucleoside phosphorylase [Hyunsoonleella sp. SJ7]|uniref:Uridine phosphorylase n=1 Tax=Hyunsoonleella aquatilis TaxID=2762758 RepID=A0A923HAP4_9FLAO|nr:nucleoside phosphorylase [Hyunsoonleella aquatilis]MBC3758914.1 nucleoside phosphorylase [Hyunsoonleella aquatilis]